MQGPDVILVGRLGEDTVEGDRVKLRGDISFSCGSLAGREGHEMADKPGWWLRPMYALHGKTSGNLNIRRAMLEMLGDQLSNFREGKTSVQGLRRCDLHSVLLKMKEGNAEYVDLKKFNRAFNSSIGNLTREKYAARSGRGRGGPNERFTITSRGFMRLG